MSSPQSKTKLMLICPYCYDGPKYEDSPGCCNETSAHFVQGIEVEDEVYTLEEYEELTSKDRDPTPYCNAGHMSKTDKECCKPYADNE